MVRKVKTYHTVTVPLGTETVTVQIKTLSVAERTEFDRLFSRAFRYEAQNCLRQRRPGEELERAVTSACSELDHAALAAMAETLRARVGHGDETLAESAVAALEQAVKIVTPTERFVIPEAEIRRRRLLDMTSAERATFERLQKEDDQAAVDLAETALPAFVRVPAGQLEVEDADTGDTTPLATGRQLLALFGSHADTLGAILLAIAKTNTLSDDEKNGSRSPSASTPGSAERDRIPPGDSPAMTAGNVAPSASVTTVAAMPTEESSSGPTAN